jgi:hypothetical protein
MAVSFNAGIARIPLNDDRTAPDGCERVGNMLVHSPQKRRSRCEVAPRSSLYARPCIFAAHRRGSCISTTSGPQPRMASSPPGRRFRLNRSNFAMRPLEKSPAGRSKDGEQFKRVAQIVWDGCGRAAFPYARPIEANCTLRDWVLNGSSGFAARICACQATDDSLRVSTLTIP